MHSSGVRLLTEVYSGTSGVRTELASFLQYAGSKLESDKNDAILRGVCFKEFLCLLGIWRSIHE